MVTTLAPMKMPQSETDWFPLIVEGVLPFLMQVMYIPLLYRCVYRIVHEKHSRAKESMRMMGMGDLSYWLSWATYFTIINTVIATLSWAVLMINAFDSNGSPYLWLYIWLYGQSLFGLLLISQSLFSNPSNAAGGTSGLYFLQQVI